MHWSSLGKLGKFFVDDLTELYHSYFSIYLISNRATKNNSVNHWTHQMCSNRPEELGCLTISGPRSGAVSVTSVLPPPLDQ